MEEKKERKGNCKFEGSSGRERERKREREREREREKDMQQQQRATDGRTVGVVEGGG